MWPLLRRARWRLTKPLRVARHAAAGALFGVKEADTEGLVLLEEFGLAAPGRVQYQPSGDTWLWRALRGLPVTREDVFLDYGSGKGKVVLQAALRYSFSKVIGVDISEELTSIARSNVERLRSRFRAAEVELVVADAAEWPLPDEVTYVYMYRPFKEALFETVLERVNESLRRNPRKLTLAYAYPEQEDVVLRNGFTRIRKSRGPNKIPQYTVGVYVRG